MSTLSISTLDGSAAQDYKIILMEIETFGYSANLSAGAPTSSIPCASEIERVFDDFSGSDKLKVSFDKTKTILWLAELLTLLPYCRCSSRLLDRALIAANEKGAA